MTCNRRPFTNERACRARNFCNAFEFARLAHPRPRPPSLGPLAPQLEPLSPFRSQRRLTVGVFRGKTYVSVREFSEARLRARFSPRLARQGVATAGRSGALPRQSGGRRSRGLGRPRNTRTSARKRRARAHARTHTSKHAHTNAAGPYPPRRSVDRPPEARAAGRCGASNPPVSESIRVAGCPGTRMRF